MNYDPSRLRALREAKKLSRQGLILAARIDITTETLRQWEVGQYTPRADHLAKIAAALEVDLTDFFTPEAA